MTIKSIAQGIYQNSGAEVTPPNDECALPLVIDKNDDYKLKTVLPNGTILTVSGGVSIASGVLITAERTLTNVESQNLSTTPIEIIPAVAASVINPIAGIMKVSNIVTPITSGGGDIGTVVYINGVATPLTENVMQFESTMSSTIDIIQAVPNNNSPAKDRLKLIENAGLFITADADGNAGDAEVKIIIQYTLLSV